jgi:hypothetical protein
MRGGLGSWGRLLLLGLLPILALAQTVPLTPPPPVVADTMKRPPVTFSVDTSRTVTVVALPPEPTDKVTRPLAIRISAAIVVLTLTTLLLYNVRSR